MALFIYVNKISLPVKIQEQPPIYLPICSNVDKHWRSLKRDNMTIYGEGDFPAIRVIYVHSLHPRNVCEMNQTFSSCQCLAPLMMQIFILIVLYSPGGICCSHYTRARMY